VKQDFNPVDILRLISELEGSSQLLNLLESYEDKETIDTMKRKYYKIYFSSKNK
tara:strand:+ start:6001 stop:6162 length:162 start_codon:yes stop_codon:yes gene_type:complete